MICRIDIFDLDGVLVDSSHRYRNLPNGTIDLDYWIENRTPEQIAKDSLLPLAKRYQESLADPSAYTVICTARAEFATDIRFIRERLGLPNKLIMRPPGNTEGDATLKRRALSRLFNLRQFRNAAKTFWDDNVKNLDALRPYGVRCVHIESNQGH